MPGRVFNVLFDHAVDQYGFVTPEDARQLGVDPRRLVEMERRGTLERIAHGVYRFPAIPRTGREQLMEAVLWPRRTRGVLSHAIALDVHGLCDINPARIDITVASDYRINRDIPALYVVHHRDLEPADITLHEGIPVVTPLRAILDGIETHVGAHLIEQAIATARRRGLVRRADLQTIARQRARSLAA